MRKRAIKHSLLIGVAVFIIAFVTPVRVKVVYAHTEEQTNTGQTSATDRKEAAQTRLADAKLKACENRQRAIKNIMARIADRGTKQLEVFTKISERTQAFYIDKGKTSNNYDALVAEVNAKKAAAETAVKTVKDSSTTFACDGDNPRGMVDGFKDSLKLEISALKDYRTAIKNLIVGVKSAQGSASSSENGEN